MAPRDSPERSCGARCPLRAPGGLSLSFPFLFSPHQQHRDIHTSRPGSLSSTIHVVPPLLGAVGASTRPNASRILLSLSSPSLGHIVIAAPSLAAQTRAAIPRSDPPSPARPIPCWSRQPWLGDVQRSKAALSCQSRGGHFDSKSTTTDVTVDARLARSGS